MKKTIYAGTYTGTGSKGIYRIAFEDGKLGEPSVFAEQKNSKYLCKTVGGLLSLGDFEASSGVAFFGWKGQLISKVGYEERTSCYIAEHDGLIYTANYHLGTFSVLAKKEGKLKLKQTILIRDAGGCHEVLFWKDLILVPCLMLDRVEIFDANLNKVGSIKFAAGTGPRHGVFTKDGEYLYLVSELSNELFVIHTGDWEIVHSISLLPNGERYARGTAAIRLNEAEDRVYVSTRGRDVISVVKMENHEPKLMQAVSCGGKHPRDFILLGNWLVVANRYTNTIISMALHEDGTIGQTISEVKVPEAVSLVTD